MQIEINFTIQKKKEETKLDEGKKVVDFLKISYMNP